MDPYEGGSEALRISLEAGISQVGESEKVSNSISWKYLTEFILDVIKAPERGMQEIPTSQTTSDPNQNPGGVPSSVPVSSAPGFGDSSGGPSGSNSDNPTKDPSECK